MDNTNTIKGVLIFMAVVLSFYLLKILSFIFIPFISAIFLALLFTPLMRWLRRKKVPKWASVTISAFIMLVVLFGTYQLIGLSVRQITQGQTEFWEKADESLTTTWAPVTDMLDIEVSSNNDESIAKELMDNEKVSEWVYSHFGSTIAVVQRMVVTILMMLFFLILLLSGSLNVQQIFGTLVFNRKNSSVKAFSKIESSIVTFIKVKTLTSLMTGIGFGLTCYFFGVSFALFWGLIAFATNYVQMIGSVVVTIFLALFALIDLTAPGSFLAFVLILVGIQVLVGGVLEPIFMGQSFRINTITVLVMLMLWGYIWGVAGLILSVPITVMLKIIFEQFKSTEVIVKVME
ncbi:AI-2E family transporter [Owenweeksia hongkongensis]|uniref:AI-2E family transporter n=1 Tax=Owenweeksia hongkongensis TaxID=253245 RepID=UPI003A905905